MLKLVFISGAIVIACCAGTAHAQSFTYTSDSGTVTQIGGTGVSGTEGMGSHSKGKVKFTHADGRKDKGSFECVSMAMPKESKIFDAHMACDVEMKDGDFSLILGCSVLNPEGTATSCVGGMKGKTGAYENRYGNFSQFAKDDKTTGSGQWFE